MAIVSAIVKGSFFRTDDLRRFVRLIMTLVSAAKVWHDRDSAMAYPRNHQ